MVQSNCLVHLGTLRNVSFMKYSPVLTRSHCSRWRLRSIQILQMSNCRSVMILCLRGRGNRSGTAMDCMIWRLEGMVMIVIAESIESSHICGAHQAGLYAGLLILYGVVFFLDTFRQVAVDFSRVVPLYSAASSPRNRKSSQSAHPVRIMPRKYPLLLLRMLSS